MEDNTLAAELQKSLEKAHTEYAQLHAEKTELQQKLADTENQLTDALAANEALTLEIEKLSSEPATPAPANPEKEKTLAEYSFEHEGITYGFNYPRLTRSGVVISAADVVASQQLQQELVAAGSSMLREK